MNFPSPSKGASLRLAAISLVGASALVIGNSAGVFAALNARTSNGTGQSINSGTLLLRLQADATNSGGLTAAIDNMAPGDSEVRLIDLDNSGTLDASSLTLSVAKAAGDDALYTDGVAPATTKALTVTVESCDVPWLADGSCSGKSKIELSSATAADYSAGRQLASATPTSGSLLHLKVTTSLPDQMETSVDGALPASTVQGKSVTLTYTFSETQRTARVIHS